MSNSIPSPFTPRIIPLVPGTPQKLSITLAGVNYELVVKWCPPAQCWMLDILDQLGEPILCGKPLITGANLLAQYDYLDLGGALVVQSDNNADAVPTFESLGVTGFLYFLN